MKHLEESVEVCINQIMELACNYRAAGMREVGPVPAYIEQEAYCTMRQNLVELLQHTRDMKETK